MSASLHLVGGRGTAEQKPLQTEYFITRQIPPLTLGSTQSDRETRSNSRLYLFNQVKVFPINVGAVQADGWIYFFF